MRKYLLGGIALTLLLSAFVCGVGALEAKSCRKSPSTACALAILTHNWPDKLFARTLLFKHGRPSYMNDLRSWAYARSTGLADSSLNRFLLEKDLSTIPPGERGEWLGKYPISLNPSSLHLVTEALHAGSYESLAATAHAGEAGNELCKGWIERNLQSISAKSLFIKTGKFTFFCAEPRPSLQLHRFWPLFSSDEQEAFLADAEGGLPEDARQLADILDWYERDVKENTPHWMRDFLREPTTRARALNLLKVRVGNSPDEDESEELLSCLNVLGEARFLAQTSGAVNTAFELADLYKDSRPELALAATRTVLTRFYEEKPQPTELDKKIVEKFSTYLDETDSTFKKGIVVELANAHNSLANSHIDEAFIGDSRRLTFFNTITDYTTSHAAAEYIRLSGHDYIETGKKYPPAGSQDHSDHAAQSWEGFVARYRWFPGTDDAYYRLAYIYLAQGNYQRAVDTVRAYSQIEKTLPDTDAGEYVRRVYYETAELDVNLTDEELPCVRVLLKFPAAKALTSTDYPFEEVLHALNCVVNLEHPSINLDRRVLDDVRELVTRLAQVPIQQRLSVAHSFFFQGHSLFLEVFYSKFSDIREMPEQAGDWSSALEIADAIDQSLVARAYTPSEIAASLIPDWIRWHEAVQDSRVRKRYKELSAKLGLPWRSPDED